MRFGLSLWSIPALVVALLVAMPVVIIALSWGSAEVDVWQHLIATGLSRLLKNTLVLMLGVGVLVMLVGVSLAWLTAVCEFPGRRWLDWALILPLAVPTYVVAFVALGVLSYSGPVLTAWRAVFGADAWYPDIRSTTGVILVMSAVLYPYVYMLARSAFMQQGRALVDAARTLGVGPFKGFVQVALPMARPAVVAGMSLALMEALADFGAVAVFNFDTFTTAIYKSWFGFFNLQAAAQLASLLLLFVALALIAEQKMRGQKRLYVQGHKERHRIVLTGLKAWLASGFCLLIFTLTFVVPVGQLLLWVWQTGLGGFDARFMKLVQHTFLLGLMAASVVVALAIIVSVCQRFGPSKPWLMKFTSLGYALPGSVLAVGVMMSFTLLDKYLLAPAFLGRPGQILVGTVFALILAYVIRYFSVGLGPVQSGLERIKPSIEEAARTLGCNRRQTLWRVYLPLLSPATLTAMILVLVDVMKEMPATLLLRPFGWDTLAVRVYEMTSEGEWQRAALPAVCLVAVSVIPVVMMMRRSRQ